MQIPQPFAAAHHAQVHAQPNINPAQMHPAMYADFPTPHQQAYREAQPSYYETQPGYHDPMGDPRVAAGHMVANPHELQGQAAQAHGAEGQPVSEYHELAAQLAGLRDVVETLAQSQLGREDFSSVRKTLEDVGHLFSENIARQQDSKFDADAYSKVVESSHTNIAQQIDRLDKSVAVAAGNPDIFTKSIEASHNEVRAHLESMQNLFASNIAATAENVQKIGAKNESLFLEMANLREAVLQSADEDTITKEDVALIEMRLEEVTRAIIAMSKGDSNVDQLERIEARISDLAKSFDPANLGSSAQNHEISRSVRDLNAKLDILRTSSEIPNDNVIARLDELQERIENFAVAAHASGGDKSGGNDLLLSRLNDLVERVGPPSSDKANDAAIANLTEKVSEVSELISSGTFSASASENSDAMNQVDQKLAELLETVQTQGNQETMSALEAVTRRLTSVEEQIASSRDVALELASQVADDAVAKAAESLAGTVSSDNSEGVVASDIVGLSNDIRKLQESTSKSESDSLESFDLLRETLESMVGRLQSIEDGMQSLESSSADMQTLVSNSNAALESVQHLEKEAKALGRTEQERAFSEAVSEAAPAQAPVAAEHHGDETHHRTSPAQSLLDEAKRANEERRRNSERKADAANAFLDEVGEYQPEIMDNEPEMPVSGPISELPVVEPPEMDGISFPPDEAVHFDSSEDVPLEPGSSSNDLAELVRQANERRKNAAQANGENSGTDFIAAARRAAQAAAEEANAAQQELDDKKASGKLGMVAALPGFLTKRKKVMMMAAAAVLLAAIAVPTVNNMLGSDSPSVASSSGSEPAIVELTENIEQADQKQDGVRLIEGDKPGPSETETASAGLDSGIDRSAETAALVPVKQPVPNYASEVTFGTTELKAAVAKNEPEALFEVGRRLMEGHGTEKDMAKASVWMERSAALGFAPAQYLIGNFHEKGIGVAQDREQALGWYEKAAQNGNIVAMHNLAVLHATPDGASGEPDMQSAFGWFKEAAEFGVRDSQVNLGIFYTKGVGTEVDLMEAYRWFTIAAKAGDRDADSKRDVIIEALRPDQLETAKSLVVGWEPKQVAQAANAVRPH
ncbi:MAG: hypothetical protein AAF412_02975 [Pseudomonadota bacterium]